VTSPERLQEAGAATPSSERGTPAPANTRDGVIDDVRIYKEPLSTAQVQALARP